MEIPEGTSSFSTYEACDDLIEPEGKFKAIDDVVTKHEVPKEIPELMDRMTEMEQNLTAKMEKLILTDNIVRRYLTAAFNELGDDEMIIIGRNLPYDNVQKVATSSIRHHMPESVYVANPKLNYAQIIAKIRELKE